MKCSIKELKVGVTYYFLAASPEFGDGIKIYFGKLKELGEGIGIVAEFDFESLEENEVFLVQHPDCGDEILDKIITLHCNKSDLDSERILGNWMRPKGFIISDSIENAINEYKEFLDWSVSEGKKNAQKLIDNGDEIEGATDMYRISLLAEGYKNQIDWLKEHYLNK